MDDDPLVSCSHTPMSKTLKTLLLLTVALTGAYSTGDDPNANKPWPDQPLWPRTSSATSNSGDAPPTGANQNNATNPFAFGAYPPPTAMNGQGWINPYMYPLFGQPPPFGFGQMPPQMFYGGFQPQAQTVPGTGAIPPPSTGENNRMAVDIPTHQVLSGSQPGSSRSAEPATGHSHGHMVAGPSCGTDTTPSRHRDMDGRSVPSNPARNRWRSPSREREQDRKGKNKALYRDLERQREFEEDNRRREAGREEGRRREQARLHAEQAPIPQHVVDMQLCNFEEQHSDSTADALRDQISMNVELMRRCDELKKLLTKRHLSPDERHGHSSKRQRESRPSQTEQRRQADYDDYLAEDEDYPVPRRQWRERGRGGFSGPPRGHDTYAPGQG